MANFLHVRLTKSMMMLLFTALISLSLKAQIVNETFNYSMNSLLTANGYTAHSGAGSSSIKVTGLALNYSGYLNSGIGNSITIDTTGEDVNKAFTEKTSGDIYVAFLMKANKVKYVGDYFFHLGPTTIGSTFLAKTFIKGDSATGAMSFGISKNANSTAGAVYTAQNYHTDSTYLVVIRYVFVSGTLNDSVFMWINPPTTGSMPSPTLITTDFTVADPANLGTYAFRQGSVANTPSLSLSGYRMTTNWSDLFVASAPTAATPTFSPVAGTYNNAQTVSINCATSGASIYYTLDGSIPTNASALYSTALSVDTFKTIKARAYKTGYDSSAVGSATFTFKAANPSYSPAPGSYVGNQNITLSCATTGASIYYTTDGSIPTVSSTLYSAPVAITTSTNFKAKAFKTGYDTSITVSGNYTISATAPAATPVFSPVGGTYNNAQTVSITTTTSGADIRYTINGGDPTSTSTLYTAALTVNAVDTIRARAFKTGIDSSAVATEIYKFKVDTVHTSLLAGSYFGTQNISLTTATTGASIRYTLDGSTPTQTSTLYTAAIPVAITSTLKARAYFAGWDSSVVSSWAYTIAIAPVALPFADTFNLAINSLLSANGYTAHSGVGTNSIKVTAPALTYTKYPKSANGNSIGIDTTGEDVSKRFVTVTSNAVFASFLVNVSKATSTGDYFFHFGADTLSTNFRGRVFVKGDSTGAIAFGVLKSSGFPSYTALSYSLNTTYLVVVKYSIVAGATNDVVELWVNPSMANSPAALLTCPDVTSGTDAVNMGTYAFRQGTSANMPRLQLSGLMIDTSWTNMFAGVPPQVETPTFSPVSGTYTSVQTVTISCATSGASIHYTTDGSNPTAASALYSTPINVGSSMAIKAKAFKTGLDSSQVAIGAYVINLPVPPTVSTFAASAINTHGATFNGMVNNTGGSTILRRGFCYSTSPNPTVANDTVGQSGGFGAFNTVKTGLSQNTMYYYKAFAINAAGISYGSEISFTTLIDGIDQSEGKSISMYPNPARNEVFINNAEGYTVTVYSLVGQLMIKEEVKTTSYQLNISELPSGMYIMSFQNDGKKFAYRLTKQ